MKTNSWLLVSNQGKDKEWTWILDLISESCSGPWRLYFPANKCDLCLVLFSSHIRHLSQFGRLTAICLIRYNTKFHHFTEGGGEDQDRRVCRLASSCIRLTDLKAWSAKIKFTKSSSNSIENPYHTNIISRFSISGFRSFICLCVLFGVSLQILICIVWTSSWEYINDPQRRPTFG